MCVCVCVCACVHLEGGGGEGGKEVRGEGFSKRSEEQILN